MNGGLNVVAMSEYLFGEKMPPPEKDKKLITFLEAAEKEEVYKPVLPLLRDEYKFMVRALNGLKATGKENQF